MLEKHIPDKENVILDNQVLENSNHRTSVFKNYLVFRKTERQSI